MRIFSFGSAKRAGPDAVNSIVHHEEHEGREVNTVPPPEPDSRSQIRSLQSLMSHGTPGNNKETVAWPLWAFFSKQFCTSLRDTLKR